jgi:hypothetical protein
VTKPEEYEYLLGRIGMLVERNEFPNPTLLIPMQKHNTIVVVTNVISNLS